MQEDCNQNCKLAEILDRPAAVVAGLCKRPAKTGLNRCLWNQSKCQIYRTTRSVKMTALKIRELEYCCRFDIEYLFLNMDYFWSTMSLD